VTFDDLGQWTIQLGAGEKLTSAEKKRIEAELPGFIRDLSRASAPARLRLPTGESLSNATRMTALKCQSLLLARSAFGANYVRANDEYKRLAKDVLFWVMRYAFISNDPKGVFCCPPCTLSLLPLYAASCFRWVDLRRTGRERPQSPERRHIGLCPNISGEICAMGGRSFHANEAPRSINIGLLVGVQVAPTWRIPERQTIKASYAGPTLTSNCPGCLLP
jgi:hypothetical protein